tara:strand:+ start:872 stop:1816 length:945 start_codon:yes stop_codon:yes gene_type:complete
VKLNNFLKKELNKKNISFSSFEFLAGDASNRKYFKLIIKNKKYLLMYDDDDKSFKNFIKITKLLKNKVTVPEIYKIFKNPNFLLIEYFGEKKYSNLIRNVDKKKLYFTAIDSLVHLHFLNFKPKLPKYTKQKFFQESKLFFEWYLPMNSIQINKSIISQFKEILYLSLEKTLLIPEVFIHRDYHIDNLFFINERKDHFKCGWIDYQDALIGPCVYDIVSLTQDARIDFPKELEKKIIEYYLKKFYKINKKDFLYSFSLIAIQRHLKVLGIFSRLSKRDKKDSYLVHIPRVKKLLKNNLEKDEFSDFNRLLKNLI